MLTRTYNSMPPRRAFSVSEIISIVECYFHYWKLGLDPGYDGYFEEQFCSAFVSFQGGEGFADAVSSGSAALFISMKLANLPPRSIVATSPVTDASVIGAIVECGHIPYLIDSETGSYNVSIHSISERWRTDIGAFVLTHAAGEPCQADKIADFCSRHNVFLIEDCSQAIGAVPKDCSLPVGNYGKVSAFSTMYRKNLSVSGSSGLLFCKDQGLFRLAKQFADRGKKWWNRELVDMRDPGFADFAGLNFNSDEIRCAIGLANLRRLKTTNAFRRRIIESLISEMGDYKLFKPYNYHDGFSPFYFPIFVDTARSIAPISKITSRLKELGVSLGERYGCLISTWDWAKPYMFDQFNASNALEVRDNCFHLYINERQRKKHVELILRAFKITNSEFCK